LPGGDCGLQGKPSGLAPPAPGRFSASKHKKVPEIDKSYNTVVQNLRLIKRPRVNVWAQNDKKWSEAGLGQDKKGNVLFIFSRSPYTMTAARRILRACSSPSKSLSPKSG